MATLCNTNLPEFRTSQFGRADRKHCASPETALNAVETVTVVFLSTRVLCQFCHDSESCSPAVLQPAACVGWPAAASCQPWLSGEGREDARGNNNMLFFLSFFPPPPLLSGRVDLRDDSLLCDSHLCAETQHTPSSPLTSPPHPAPCTAP